MCCHTKPQEDIEKKLTQIFTRNTWDVGKKKHRRDVKTAVESTTAQK